jgi:NitT/TauT family transport system permease protein
MNWRKKILPVVLYGSGVVISMLLWWYATSDPLSLLHRFNLPDTAVSFWGLLQNGHFWYSLSETLKRLVFGILISFAVGLPIGLAIGYFRAVNHISYITFQFLRNISPLSWTPVAIILFGIGDNPVYFLVSIAAIWPIILNTSSGVQLTDKDLIDVARGFGANSWQTIKHIVLRSTLPSILVGLQLAIGVGWIVIVPAEMLGVTSGLGYLILDYRDINDYASIMAVVISIGIIGVLLDYPLRLLTKKVAWN